MQTALFLLMTVLAAESAENLQCLKAGPGEPPESSLYYSHLQQHAYQALDLLTEQSPNKSVTH